MNTDRLTSQECSWSIWVHRMRRQLQLCGGFSKRFYLTLVSSNIRGYFGGSS